MKGDHCAHCPTGIIQTQTGRLCPQCLFKAHRQGQAITSIKLILKIREKAR